MRPPDLPGGNKPRHGRKPSRAARRFNEAAGFTRRKQQLRVQRDRVVALASMRPPDLPGGNTGGEARHDARCRLASMRPPDLPGGNPSAARFSLRSSISFNEAAGFTRRKRRIRSTPLRAMRPMLQ